MSIEKFPSNIDLGVKIVQLHRWIRTKVGDTIVVNSKAPILLVEYGKGKMPTYYFEPTDVHQEFLKQSDFKGKNDIFTYWNIQIGDNVIKNAAYAYTNNIPPEYQPLKGLLAFKWNALDQWFEEEEELFGHPRDPFHRIDTRYSSRHIKIELNGTLLAETKRSILLFETNLRTRYYIPKEDAKMDLLERTKTETICAYKGKASYWSIKLDGQEFEDYVWAYEKPLREFAILKDTISYYNEKLDIYVDGELEKR